MAKNSLLIYVFILIAMCIGTASASEFAYATTQVTAILPDTISISATPLVLTGVAPSAVATGSNTVTVTCNAPFTLGATALNKMTTGSGADTYTLSDPLKMSSSSTGPFSSLMLWNTLATENAGVSGKQYTAYYQQQFGTSDPPGNYATTLSWQVVATWT